MESVRVYSKQSKELFETSAGEAMRELCTAFLGIMENLPATIHRAGDLERVLGVSATLAWQIHGLATSANPLAVSKLVPGPSAVRRVLRGARSKGVPEHCLQRVDKAAKEMQQFISQHAGDRATFIAMMNALAGNEIDAIDEKMRKQAFRINSQLWGTQMKTAVGCAMFYPGRDETVHNILSLRGMLEIRRLRPGAPFQLAGQRAMGVTELSDCGTEASEKIERIDGPLLLKEFCSSPCPKIEHRLENGYVETLLCDAPLGNAGKQTVYLASALRDVKWHYPEDHGFIRNAVCRKPIETLVVDTLIWKGMFSPVVPEAKVYGSLDRYGELQPENFRPEEELPMKVQVQSLGSGLSALPTAHVPRYTEMIALLCSRAGLDPQNFEAFRCTIKYPMLGSVLMVRFPLPQETNG